MESASRLEETHFNFPHNKLNIVSLNKCPCNVVVILGDKNKLSDQDFY